MKRIVIVIAALTLTLAGCAKGTDIGQNQGTGCGKSGNEKCATSIPSSKAATPTAVKTSKKPSTPPTTSVPANPGSNYSIVIHSNGSGYEPAQLVVRVGDTIVFQNLDPDTATGHTFTGREHEWDSGIVKYKGSAKVKITLAPGDYYWFDQQVPYLTGGPLRVIPAA